MSGAAQVLVIALKVKSVGHDEHWLMALPEHEEHVVSHFAQYFPLLYGNYWKGTLQLDCDSILGNK